MNDRTGTIRASIADVEFTLVVAIVLVVLVVLLFLRSVRATIIAGISLPLSIIATFATMWSANLWSRGFSLDNLSLMALTIGTGFVVDDAIVMIENIVRNMEKGKTPIEAALDGAREIGFTVVSLTVSLIAVFIPLLFMTGIVGRMFREFAMTLTMAVVVSALVSLTLTPMLCARLLRPLGHGGGGHEENPSSWLDRLYQRTLDWSLKHQPLILMLTVATFALTIALYVFIPKGFLPRQDTGVLSVVLEAAPDVSFDAIKKMQKDVAAIFRKDKDVTGVASVLGVGPLNPTTNVGHFTVMLRDENSSFRQRRRHRRPAQGGSRNDTGRDALHRARSRHSDHDQSKPIAISIHDHDGRQRGVDALDGQARRRAARRACAAKRRGRNAGRGPAQRRTHRPGNHGPVGHIDAKCR